MIGSGASSSLAGLPYPVFVARGRSGYGFANVVNQRIDVLGGGAPRTHEARAAADEDVIFPASATERLVGVLGKFGEDGVGFDRVQDPDAGKNREGVAESTRKGVGAAGDFEPKAVA